MTDNELQALNAGVSELEEGNLNLYMNKFELNLILADEDLADSKKLSATLQYCNALAKQIGEYKKFIKDIQNNNLDTCYNFNQLILGWGNSDSEADVDIDVDTDDCEYIKNPQSQPLDITNLVEIISRC